MRAALQDGDQRLVKTVPRRGYLLDVPVSPTDGPPGPPAPVSAAAVDPPTEAGIATDDVQPEARRAASGWRARGRLAAAALVAAIAVVMLSLGWRHLSAPPPSDRASIAVLPFSSGHALEHDYFSDGLTEDLITSLGRFRGLFVIARDSTFVYKGKTVTPQQVGRELGVRYLLEGGVRREGDNMRITTRLIDAATGGQIWGESYDRALSNISAVQDDVTQNIVGVSSPTSTAPSSRASRGRRPTSLAAYDLYLRGKALLTMRHGDTRGAMVTEARRLFEQALAADPQYAPAVQGLAYTYAAAFLEPMATVSWPANGGSRRPSSVRSRWPSGPSSSIPTSAEAHATLGWILHWRYRRGEALAEFQRALELNPNLVDGRYAHLLVHNGRASDAVTYMLRALRQDPFPPPIYLSYLGNAYYMTGQYDPAYETLRRGRERMPDYRAMTVWLAAAAAQSGREAEAREAADCVRTMAPSFTITAWLRHIQFERQLEADRLAQGLRKAGLPF